MELTTQKLIHILPIDEEVRKDILQRWDTMDPDEKFQTERILWDTYYELFRIRLEKNLQLKLSQLGEENSDMEADPEFYKRVSEQTEKEMQSENYKTADVSELGNVRTKLEELMKIHAIQ